MKCRTTAVVLLIGLAIMALAACSGAAAPPAMTGTSTAPAGPAARGGITATAERSPAAPDQPSVYVPLVQANVPFEHLAIDNSYPTQVGDCKALGDINGDGFVDIVFAGDKLYWYAYPSWKRTVIAAANQEFSTSMRLGDVDGDGDLDVVVPDGPRGRLSWLENPRPGGDPSTASWTRHVIGDHGTWAHDVEVGDINSSCG